jgi:hypothetical protein
MQLLASLPHGGGLMYLGFCLFHQKEAIRECTVNLFNQLRAYPVSCDEHAADFADNTWRLGFSSSRL